MLLHHKHMIMRLRSLFRWCSNKNSYKQRSEEPVREGVGDREKTWVSETETWREDEIMRGREKMKQWENKRKILKMLQRGPWRRRERPRVGACRHPQETRKGRKQLSPRISCWLLKSDFQEYKIGNPRCLEPLLWWIFVAAIGNRIVWDSLTRLQLRAVGMDDSWDSWLPGQAFPSFTIGSMCGGWWCLLSPLCMQPSGQCLVTFAFSQLTLSIPHDNPLRIPW